MRECNLCVYSSRDGGCRAFECKGTVTVDKVKFDAIDEFMNMFEQKSADIFNDWCKDKRNLPTPTLASGVSVARGIAEQLKEQSND